MVQSSGKRFGSGCIAPLVAERPDVARRENMTREEATRSARRHLDAEPFPDPDYRWILAPAHDLGDAWYFDYSFENVRGLPASEWEGFVGAPGFIVPKDGAAPRDLSWEEYSDHELGKRAP